MPLEIDFILRRDERRICANHGEDVYLWVGDHEEVVEDRGCEVVR